MYSEKTFKNYIFWIQVKRVFLIILLSCLGAGLRSINWWNFEKHYASVKL